MERHPGESGSLWVLANDWQRVMNTAVTKKSGVPDRVKFIGHLEGDAKQEGIKGAGMVLHPIHKRARRNLPDPRHLAKINDSDTDRRTHDDVGRKMNPEIDPRKANKKKDVKECHCA